MIYTLINGPYIADSNSMRIKFYKITVIFLILFFRITFGSVCQIHLSPHKLKVPVIDLNMGLIYGLNGKAFYPSINAHVLPLFKKLLETPYERITIEEAFLLIGKSPEKYYELENVKEALNSAVLRFLRALPLEIGMPKRHQFRISDRAIIFIPEQVTFEQLTNVPGSYTYQDIFVVNSKQNFIYYKGHILFKHKRSYSVLLERFVRFRGQTVTFENIVDILSLKDQQSVGVVINYIKKQFLAVDPEFDMIQNERGVGFYWK